MVSIALLVMIIIFESTWFPIYWAYCLPVFTLVLTISQFKSRKKQLQLSQVTFILITACFLAVELVQWAVKHEMPQINTIIFPLLAFIFNWIAVHFTKKDEAKVSSIDRIR
jgi:hypothetical protein